MKPKILFIYTNNVGVAYYRMYCFAKKMSELGIADTRFYPSWDPNRLFSPNWEEKIWENIPDLANSANWADVIVCQYVSTPEGVSFVESIKDHDKKILMEVDDLFSNVPYYSMAYENNMPGDRQDYWASRQLLASDGVITTTDFLRNQYLKFNPKVYVVPNCIDFDLWQTNGIVHNNKVRVGWIGGATHELDLKLVKDVIYDIVDKRSDIEFTIVSAPPPSWHKHENINLIEHWETIDKYPKYVSSLHFDIGMVPLRDNMFNRGKSNLRYLEYSAMGIPSIASSVEPFKKDFCGLRANSDSDWYNAILDLSNNEEVRSALGLLSYNSVKDKFNVCEVSNRYCAVVKEVLGWE
jgi:processive 1,2-diacylglycerol beta-glucosyltransferase